MQVFAIAGGAGPSGEDALSCCGCFPMLPLVVYLAGRAILRGSARPAVLALVLAGVPFLVLWHVVAGYRPSADGDVVSDQHSGWTAFGFYAALVGVAGLSLLTAWGRPHAVRGQKQAEPAAVVDPLTKPGGLPS